MTQVPGEVAFHCMFAKNQNLRVSTGVLQNPGWYLPGGRILLVLNSICSVIAHSPKEVHMKVLATSWFILVAVLILSGCAGSSVTGFSDRDSRIRSLSPSVVGIEGTGGKLTIEFARKGVELIRQGKYEEASREFGKSLRYDPQNSSMQFLNGFAYHLMAESANPDRYESARIGYELALKFDPNNWLAAQQLARLCLATRDYRRAQEYFAYALLYRPNDPALLFGLAQSSYYLSDIETAFGASRKAAELMPGSPQIVGGHAIISSAAGQVATAQQSLAALRALDPTGLHLAKVEERIDDWRTLYSQSSHSDERSVQRRDLEPSQPQTTIIDDSSSSILAQHKMVMIDVVMLRTEENETSTKGLNLLQNLSLSFSGSYFGGQTRMPDADAWSLNTRSITNAISMSEAKYSLDIFNAGDDRTEVLALPTLIALDGKPSSSFAGLTLNVAVSGYQTGTLSQLEAGITLEALPTFLSDNTIQLHVVARRTFVEQGGAGTFKEAVRTSKNEVTADVVMNLGQTLVLSGLREKQTTAIKAGVPVLRDIPIIQYLFSHEETYDFHKSILVLLTPRRVSAGMYRSAVVGERSDGAASPGEQAKLDEFRLRYGYILDLEPNLLRVLKHLDKHEVARGLRSADFFDAPWWGSTDSIDIILKRAASFLFY